MMSIDLSSLVLRRCRMKLKSAFSTSFGSFLEKEFFILEVQDREGHSGWGESVAFDSPWYTEETVKTTEHILKDFLIPLIRKAPLTHPDELVSRWSSIRGNPMAKSSIEGAIWDLYAKQNNWTLSQALGGEKSSIDVGISIGIQDSLHELYHLIGKAVHDGYARIKLKIKPGHDVEVVRAVRNRFPNIPLMVDANSAYTLKDTERLKQLDAFNLMMIEQPLGAEDLLDHAALQKELDTPICLDESIHSFKRAQDAIKLGSAKIINIKIGRVGGLSVSRQIHDLCQKHDIPVWCGGMLEAGVGRAHNIAITSLPQFTLPGDTSGSDRYWEKDIICPEVIMRKGKIHVPENPGIGYSIDHEALDFFTVQKETLSLVPDQTSVR